MILSGEGRFVMSDMIAVRDKAPWFRRLYLPTYRLSDAARYAGTSTQTIANWHYRDLPSYGFPALPRREHRQRLSYLELIEIAVVATFRAMNVPLGNIAKTRSYMAQTLNAEFPFAEYRFKTDGYHLLMNLAEVEPILPSTTDDLIVADAGGQLGWNAMMIDRLLEFDYDLEHELALQWFAAGRQSQVVIDPRVSYGAPVVKGIPTWVLKGRWTAGESISDIQEDFNLEEKEIGDGLRFEGVKVAA